MHLQWYCIGVVNSKTPSFFLQYEGLARPCCKELWGRPIRQESSKNAFLSLTAEGINITVASIMLKYIYIYFSLKATLAATNIVGQRGRVVGVLGPSVLIQCCRMLVANQRYWLESSGWNHVFGKCCIQFIAVVSEIGFARSPFCCTCC